MFFLNICCNHQTSKSIDCSWDFVGEVWVLIIVLLCIIVAGVVWTGFIDWDAGRVHPVAFLFVIVSCSKGFLDKTCRGTFE
ncbi:hypothetical protein Hanom_Chr04g00318781 [Helianthus anomalus]